MTVTGYLDGNQVTRVFNATSPEDLRTKNAEAYALYVRLNGQQFGFQPGFLPRGNAIIHGNIQLQINAVGGPLRLQQPIRPLLIPPAPINPQVDPLDRLQQKIHEQIKQNHLPQEQQAKVTSSWRNCRSNRGNCASRATFPETPKSPCVSSMPSATPFA